MPNYLNEKYDAVIIGAGISGLVCGCYLAKFGMKVLIVEKNDRPGGCCVSFTRDKFRFDLCGHSLGGLGKEGIIGMILEELNIADRIKISRYNPSDIFIMPDNKFYLWNELDKVTSDFQSMYPKERKNIAVFFNFINKSNNALELLRLKDISFKNLLDRYFRDKQLKNMLSIPVLVNCGTNAFCVSAFTAIKLYKQYIFDCGYYPKGGVGEFPNILAKRLLELGGQICLSTLVNKIKVKGNQVVGVYLNDTFIEGRYIVSNADSRQTFLNLLGEDLLSKNFIRKLKNLQVSNSMYILYLGLKNNLSNSLLEGVTNWVIADNIEDILTYAKDKNNIGLYAIRLLPGKNTIVAFTDTFYKDEKYWLKNKDIWMNNFIEKITQHTPNLSKYLAFKEAATPISLYKYSLNYRGAKCGWASVPSQFAISGFSQSTPVENLYLTGHWTTLALGVTGVAYIGKDTAKIILKKKKKYE